MYDDEFVAGVLTGLEETLDAPLAGVYETTRRALVDLRERIADMRAVVVTRPAAASEHPSKEAS